VRIEVGTEQFDAIATVAQEPERSQLYSQMAAKHTFFAEYAQKISRTIPVIILTRS
jgi:hypothetical protein